MTCEVCGTEVPATARFCPGCGAPATTPATSAPMPEAVARAWATLAGTVYALPLVAVSVAAAGLLLAVIGLAIATGEEPLSMGFLHGSIWLDLGIVLEGGAFALFAAARGRRAVPPWVASTSRLAAAAGAVLTLVFAIVALAVVYGDLTAEDLADGGAWAGFSGAWTTFVLGWLTWCRPLSRREGVGAAVVFGVLGVLFALVGLTTGLGDDFEDGLRGEQWLFVATVVTTLAAGALLGRSPEHHHR